MAKKTNTTALKTKEPKMGDTKTAFIRKLLWRFGKGGKKPENWSETLDFFGHQCVYCGNQKDKLEKDHAIPANRKYLGTNQHGNFVPACPDCNAKKGGNQNYEEFCDQIGNKSSKKKIAQWMNKCGYVPLTANETRRKKIEAILDMLYEDIDRLGTRYEKLIDLIR